MLNQFHDGDTEAGVKLLQSQGAWIYRRVEGFNIPPSVEMDDILSELLVVLLKAIPSFEPDRGAFSTFVTKIVDRRTPRIVDFLIGKFPATGLSGVLAPEDTMVEDTYLGDECQVDDMEMQELLKQISHEELSENTRCVLEDHLEGHPLAEVARRLNDRLSEKPGRYRLHTPSSVLSIIKRALDHIRQEAQRRGAHIPGKDFNLRMF